MEDQPYVLSESPLIVANSGLIQNSPVRKAEHNLMCHFRLWIRRRRVPENISIRPKKRGGGNQLLTFFSSWGKR